MEQKSIFLTTAQAIQAIAIDFRQYAPQITLFCSIIDMISGETIHFRRQPDKVGLWINQGGRPNMRWLNGNELIEFMCTAIHKTRWTPELLAGVCRRVFQSRAEPAVNPENGQAGIRIETDMAPFTCRQCGRCCRNLDYHHEVTAEDVALWQTLDRKDILEWVDPVIQDGNTIGYRVWIAPGTHQQAGICPFLKKNPTANRWGCRIHAVKPQICRNYPVNRKHAAMTDCQGFSRSCSK